MAHYDPAVIQQFADRLYSRADRMLVSYSVLAGLVCAVPGGAFGFAIGGHSDGSMIALFVAFFCGLVGCVGGYLLASERAFAMKLAAQTALCYVQIEANTRASAHRAQYAA